MSLASFGMHSSLYNGFYSNNGGDKQWIGALQSSDKGGDFFKPEGLHNSLLLFCPIPQIPTCSLQSPHFPAAVQTPSQSHFVQQDLPMRLSDSQWPLWPTSCADFTEYTHTDLPMSPCGGPPIASLSLHPSMVSPKGWSTTEFQWSSSQEAGLFSCSRKSCPWTLSEDPFPQRTASPSCMSRTIAAANMKTHSVAETGTIEGSVVGRGDGPRVDEPYAQLIYKAFMSKKRKAMTLHEIYQWFRNNTDKSKAENKGWQNSVRHNLSMNKVGGY
jgi:hypothetical protein